MFSRKQATAALAILVVTVLALRALSSAATASAQPADLSITTDKASYAQGASIKVCYQVPAPGSVTIIQSSPANGSVKLFQGIETGSGNCLPAVAPNQPGQICFQIDHYSNGLNSSAQSCAQVLPAATPTPAGMPSPTPAPAQPAATATPKSAIGIAAGTALLPPLGQLPPIAITDLEIPELLTTTFVVAPGGNVTVTGSHLGSATGRLQLTFDAPPASVDLNVSSWSDSGAVGGLPLDFAGRMDGPAHVVAYTAKGIETGTLDIQFVATRQTVVMDGQFLQITCPNATQFDSCQPLGKTVTIEGVHQSDCCINGVVSIDDYGANLKNSWTVSSVDFKLNPTEELAYQGICLSGPNVSLFDALGDATLSSRPWTGSTSINLRVTWSVNANCSPVVYDVKIFITGPAGVPYQGQPYPNL